MLSLSSSISISGFHYFIPLRHPSILLLISFVLSSTSRSRIASGPLGSPSTWTYHDSLSPSRCISYKRLQTNYWKMLIKYTLNEELTIPPEETGKIEESTLVRLHNKYLMKVSAMGLCIAVTNIRYRNNVVLRESADVLV